MKISIIGFGNNSVLDKCVRNQIFKPNSSAINEQTDYQVVRIFRQKKSNR